MNDAKAELLEIVGQIRGLIGSTRVYSAVVGAGKLVAEAIELGAFSKVSWFQFRQQFDDFQHYPGQRPDYV